MGFRIGPGRTFPAVCAALVCCSAEPQDPEAQIRSLLSRGEAAASEKDLATIKGVISDSYSDTSGQDKQAIVAIIRLNFLRNDSIHLLTGVKGVQIVDPTHAEASVFVAMAGQPRGLDRRSRRRSTCPPFEPLASPCSERRSC